jgi:hypothetical protein
VVVLGKQLFASVDPAFLSTKVIFCLDNDGKNLRTDTTILAAANRLREHQKEVRFMLPTDLKSPKQDYNDTLRQAGNSVIQRDFSASISYEDFYKNKEHSSTIPPEKMALFSKEMTKEIGYQNKAQLNAYQSMINKNQQVSTDKILPKIKDIQHEI